MQGTAFPCGEREKIKRAKDKAAESLQSEGKAEETVRNTATK